jgi:hypothetical protein
MTCLALAYHYGRICMRILHITSPATLLWANLYKNTSYYLSCIIIMGKSVNTCPAHWWKDAVIRWRYHNERGLLGGPAFSRQLAQWPRACLWIKDWERKWLDEFALSTVIAMKSSSSYVILYAHGHQSILLMGCISHYTDTCKLAVGLFRVNNFELFNTGESTAFVLRWPNTPVFFPEDLYKKCIDRKVQHV